MKIPISEIFYSIQGEGRNTGKPSIFVRLWGCNLRCTWCDTPYAVTQAEHCKQEELDEIVGQITQHADQCKHIIFTGGEPSLYEKHIQAIKRHKDIVDEGYTYEIETNGSMELQNYYEQVNCSPKFTNSGNKPYELKILKSESFDFLDFKFVVDNFVDIEEVEQFVRDNFIDKEHVWIMPLGITQKSQTRPDLAESCVKRGWNYSPRMHIVTFGNKKGV